MNNRILLVDDEPAVFDGIRRQLYKTHDLTYAASGVEALAMLEANGPFAVICSDMRMPGMDGASLLAEAARRHPDTVRVMLTGNADQETAVEAINKGRIYGFLTKPVTRETLAATFDGALRLHAVTTAEKDVLERTLAGSIRILIEILAATLPEVFGRTTRVRDLCRVLAGMVEVNRWRLDMAALLGAIGWTTVPPKLIEKYRLGANLGVDEADMVARVPEIGARLIANIPRLGPIADIIRQQRHRFDGADAAGGTPVGTALSIEARVLRLASDLVETAGGAPPTEAHVLRLYEDDGAYDPELLGMLHGHLRHQQMTTAEQAPAVAEETSIGSLSLLHAGDRLLDGLRFTDGSLAVGADTVVTDVMVQKLLNLARLREFRLPIRVQREPMVE
jgi:response regulator RpfG family c-di-GMP phosphodiesterase